MSERGNDLPQEYRDRPAKIFGSGKELGEHLYRRALEQLDAARREIEHEREEYHKLMLSRDAIQTERDRLRARIAELEAERDLAQRDRDSARKWAMDELHRITELEAALRELEQAFSRMPDAGFSIESPRWNWWHETFPARERARNILNQEGARK